MEPADLGQGYGYRYGLLADAFQEAARNTAESRRFNRVRLHKRANAKDLRPGDHVIILAQERAPLDSRWDQRYLVESVQWFESQTKELDVGRRLIEIRYCWWIRTSIGTGQILGFLVADGQCAVFPVPCHPLHQETSPLHPMTSPLHGHRPPALQCLLRPSVMLKSQ